MTTTTTTCPNHHHPTIQSLLPITTLLLLLSIFILLFTTLLAQAGAGLPRSQLGKRPYGYGLYTYLYHHLIDGVGVRGYDSSLGCMAPTLRLMMHICGYLVCWVGTIVLVGGVMNLYYSWSFGVGEGNDVGGVCSSAERTSSKADILSAVQDAGWISMIWYSTFYILYWKMSRGVSDPGGPREHKIQRMPHWDDKLTTLNTNEDGGEWICEVAMDSHVVTENQFKDILEKNKTNNGAGKEKKSKKDKVVVDGGGTAAVKAGLSGEPVGRQIWTLQQTKDKKSSSGDDGSNKTVVVDEKLVQEMASGGRPLGFNPSVNPNSCDMVLRSQLIRTYLQKSATNKAPPIPDLKSKPKTVMEAAKKGVHFHSMLQTSDGHWAADYGGPHFLMPGIVIGWYVMNQPSLLLSPQQRSQMRHYLTVHQQSDGGWGTHIESPSTMFGTVLCYVSLRLLGENMDSNVCIKGREFIKKEGGAVYTSSWAKFWLCVLGCMDWEAHNSVPPEMWLLPNWFPFHPGRLWCHCRMVYLPMGYLYGSRFVYDKAETDPLIQSLREELYCQPYTTIPWSQTRHYVADMDNYSPIPYVMSFLQDCLAIYEKWIIFQPFKNFVRNIGLKFCVDYMKAEDLQTNFVCIGPVNKAMNMVSAYHAANNNINHPTVINHMMRVPDYLWLAEDGMKMQGYNGCQCWDTSFAVQAVDECGLLDEFPDLAKKAWSFLERTQILSTETSRASSAHQYESPQNRDKYYRHVSQGGWPFSTSAHGWPISDCTGEGLKGTLALMNHSRVVKEGIENGSLREMKDERFFDAVNVILTLQNEDGGWATYENNRGFGWYEQLNPSEVFGDIMIDYSYVECSMASLTALSEFHDLYPDHRTKEIKFAISRGREFMISIQRPDGSWYGSWACCFCYGCWFGIEGLIKSGESPTSPTIQKCCTFLLSHQRPNGGWGEDFTSCYDKDYAMNGMDEYGDDGGSGVVNTGWALLALSAAKCNNVEAIRRGVKYLMKRQLPCGDWPQEGIAGVFNRACGITYTSYRNVFPIWALGRCAATYGDELDK